MFFRTSSSNNKFSHSYRKAQMLFLHDEIKTKKRELKTCQSYLQQTTENCKSSLSQLLFLVLQSTCNNNQSKVNSITTLKHLKKLNNLKRIQKPEPLIPNNDEFVINLSSVTLSDEEKRVLSYGLNYAFPSRKPKLHDFLAPTERLCQSLKKDHTISDDRWTEFTDHLRSYLHKTKHFNLFVNKKQQLQYDKDMDILRRLLDNKNIIICRPDKGNAVVVLNKSDYITKMETILNDKSKFHKVHDDVLKLSISLENKFIDLLRKLNVP